MISELTPTGWVVSETLGKDVSAQPKSYAYFKEEVDD